MQPFEFDTKLQQKVIQKNSMTSPSSLASGLIIKTMQPHSAPVCVLELAPLIVCNPSVTTKCSSPVSSIFCHFPPFSSFQQSQSIPIFTKVVSYSMLGLCSALASPQHMFHNNGVSCFRCFFLMGSLLHPHPPPRPLSGHRPCDPRGRPTRRGARQPPRRHHRPGTLSLPPMPPLCCTNPFGGFVQGGSRRGCYR